MSELPSRPWQVGDPFSRIYVRGHDDNRGIYGTTASHVKPGDCHLCAECGPPVKIEDGEWFGEPTKVHVHTSERLRSYDFALDRATITAADGTFVANCSQSEEPTEAEIAMARAIVAAANAGLIK